MPIKRREHPTEHRPIEPLKHPAALRPVLAVLGCVALLLAPPGLARGEFATSDQRFLAGLRQRGLFELADGYCTARLRAPDLSDARRADLVIELSLTLADWAVNSPPDQREPLWNRALRVADDFAREHPQCPQRVLVSLQGALGVLSRGELAREESQLAGQGEKLLEEARQSLQAAVEALERLAREVEEQLRQRNRPARAGAPRAEADALSVHQLASLRDNIRYQLARAYRNQGQCYPAGSPDWASALTLAVETLDPLTKLDTSHPLAWKARIDEVVCTRLLADFPAAQRKLDALLAAGPPSAIALQARAEQIRLALATNRLPDAVAMLTGERRLEGRTSGDLDVAFLETCLAAWRAAQEAKREQEAAAWQAKANAVLRLIRQDDGPYWTRRAQMLMAGQVQSIPGGDLALWIEAAANAYQSGQYDDALAAYDRARGLAEQEDNAGQAFDLGFTAATIEHQRGRHEEAVSRYRRLALDMPTEPKAAEAHLLALYHAGQIAKQAPGAPLDQVIALAEEHLATWPHDPAADEARWSLAGARAHQGDWEKAVEQYRAITPSSPRFAQAVEAAERSYQAWLDECVAAGKPPEAIAAAAAAWFESLVIDPQGRLPERWSPVARTAALAAARFRLNYTTTAPDRAERILSAALEGAGDATPEWQSSARALLVFSLAAQGRRDEARAALGRLSAGPPQELLKILQRLAGIGATAPPRVKAELAELELGMVDLLRAQREKLDPAEQRALDAAAAGALADAGRTGEALDAYGRLAQAYPDDGDVQEGYARLLLARHDSPARQSAMAKWREVEKKSLPGSDRWFRAKLALALLHYSAGNAQQAEKILQLAEILHPQPRLRDRPVTADFLQSLDPQARAALLELLERR